jgi:hypothetical protein
MTPAFPAAPGPPRDGPPLRAPTRRISDHAVLRPPGRAVEDCIMLTDLVTRALSHLTGNSIDAGRIKGRFQYAYASDDGKYVAILAHDMTTYVVDLPGKRYFAECGGAPRGFSGHVLEMEGDETRLHPWPAHSGLFDLDMDGEEIDWLECPEPQGRFHAARVYS